MDDKWFLTCCVASVHRRSPRCRAVHKKVPGSEPLVQVPSVPEQEPPHGVQVRRFAGPNPEPQVRFRFKPSSQGSRTGPWPV